MSTVHTINTNAAIMALALHGAASLGLSIDEALIYSPDALSAKLYAMAAKRKAAKLARIASASRTAEPHAHQPETKQEPIDGIAAMRALAKQLKQS